jgi:hypothetical protein
MSFLTMFFGLINNVPFAKSQNKLANNKVMTGKNKINNDRF